MSAVHCRCVIPVLTKSRNEVELPFGLRALKGVDMSWIVNDTDTDGRSLLDRYRANNKKPEHWRPARSDIDRSFLDNMTQMLNERISLRQQREQTQTEELEAWKTKEQMNRCLQREQQKLAAEVERMKLETSHEQKLKPQRQQVYDSLHTTEPTQVKTHHHFVNMHMSFCHNGFFLLWTRSLDK